MSNLEREVESYVGEPRVPCTGNGGNGCKLLEHRTSVNQILLEAGLEIREDDRHPGGLRMAVTHISVCNSPVWDEPRAWLNNQSLKLARNLIFHHCCFTAIETYSTVPWPYWMRQALRRSCALKSFTVHLVLRVDAHQNDHQDIFRLLYSLKSPVELVFEMAPSTLHTTRVPIRGKIPEKTLRHMTTLRAENLIITPPNARAFLCVLLDNHTITDLGVHACVFRRLPRDSGALFALYLTRRRAALKKLTLADFHCCGDQALWMRLIPALSEMTALEELDVHVSLELEIYHAVIGAFARVVHQCPQLRRLRLPCRMPVFGTLSPQFDDTQWMTSWLGALEETRTLRELRICLLGMTDAQCRSLFLGIAGSDTLDHVVFEDVADCLNLETLSKLIQNFGIGDRVRFRHLSITHQNSPVLSKVTALSSLTFNSLGVQLHSWYPMEHLLNCCKTVSRRGTKMTLNVHCDLMRQSAFGDLLSWLAQSSTLTDVAIDCFNHADTYRCEECADMCSKLVSAVASNGNITGVTLVSLRLEAEHLNMLCESARMYRRLTEISVLPACVDFKACVREKQRRWTEGYHAATVQLQYVVHQNASRIGPAVRFVLGRDITAEEAIALEYLYDHPRVLERVRHEARVTNAEAAAMVKRAAAKLRNMNVHYYMWLAGVVKKRQAVRLDPDSQEVHILDLPLECWIHIRRYLKIADVASARPRLA